VANPCTGSQKLDPGAEFSRRLTLDVKGCYLREMSQGVIEQAKKALIKAKVALVDCSQSTEADRAHGLSTFPILYIFLC